MGSYAKYTVDDDRMIRELSAIGAPDAYIAETLGRSDLAIRQRRMILGIKKVRCQYPIKEELQLIQSLLLLPDETKILLSALIQKVYIKGEMNGLKKQIKIDKLFPRLKSKINAAIAY
jgi:hypothetical protein